MGRVGGGVAAHSWRGLWAREGPGEFPENSGRGHVNARAPAWRPIGWAAPAARAAHAVADGGGWRTLPTEELEDDQPKRPHVERARGTHAVGLLAEHRPCELRRAVAGRDAHRDRLASATRILEVDDLR